MRIIKINENRFKLINDKFKQYSKEMTNLDNLDSRLEQKKHDLFINMSKELKEYKKNIMLKLERITFDKFDELWDKSSVGSRHVYGIIARDLSPKADKIISGSYFERKLTKTINEVTSDPVYKKQFNKTHIRALIVLRNDRVRYETKKPISIKMKYTKKIKELDNKIAVVKNQRTHLKTSKYNPFYRIIKGVEDKISKVEINKKQIRELNEKYRNLDKIKPIWKGMQYADDYYNKKETIKDKYIVLDIKKEELETKINELIRNINYELFDIKLK